MWQAVVLSFFAGAVGGLSFPHFVKGATKQSYPCLLGNTPVPNLVAGWSGLLLAALLVYWAPVGRHPVWPLVLGALGVLLGSLVHAWHGAVGRKA
jgi:hypothetical protein